MSIIEKIRAEVLRLIRESDGPGSPYGIGKMSACNRILNFLDTIQEQPVCEGLYDFMKKRSESLCFHDDFEIAAYKKGVVDGAKWQKEQMMKEAVEGTIFPTIRTKEIDEQMFDNIISRFNGEHFKYEMLQAMKRWLVELRKKLFLLNEAVKVEGEVTETCGIASIWIKTKQFKHGDKVKLIIIKED